jgi:hypothetical protein
VSGGTETKNEQSIIADTTPKVFSAGQSSDITVVKFCEAMQCSENTHSCRLIKSADISLGRFRPNNPLHIDFMNRWISSSVIPSSARPWS